MKYIKKRRRITNVEARISGTTKLFGLIGSPVSHSASPAMQNYGFQACGVDGAYLAFDIKEEEVPEFVKSMRSVKYSGMIMLQCQIKQQQLRIWMNYHQQQN